MSEKPQSPSLGSQAETQVNTAPGGATQVEPAATDDSQRTKKRILVGIVIVVALIVFKNVLWAVASLVITTVIFVVIGLVAYSAWQMARENEQRRLKELARQQERFFAEETDGLHRGDAQSLIKQAHDYFLEKTWGMSGLKWRVNNMNAAEGKIIADFECFELKNHDLLPPEAAASRGAPQKSFGIFPSILPAPNAGGRRYVCVRMQAINDTTGGATLQYSWEFRYPEQSEKNRPPALPEGLFEVCKDLVHSMKKESGC